MSPRSRPISAGHAAMRPAPAAACWPPRPADPLAAEHARIERAYGRWITANQLAAEEGCSIRTARRQLLAGAYGRPVDRQPGGALRLLTSIYVATRRARTLNP